MRTPWARLPAILLIIAAVAGCSVLLAVLRSPEIYRAIDGSGSGSAAT